MAGSPNKVHQWLTLGLPFPLIVVNGWLALQVFHFFQQLLTIFVLAGLLAFSLNYPVQFLQRYQVKRNYAVVLVFLLALAILIASGITFIPLLLEQLSQSAKLLPSWIDSGSQELQTLDDWAAARNLSINLSQLATQLSDRLPDELQSLAEELFTLAFEAVDSVSEIALTVVLTFYLLLDGERLWNELFQRLPPRFSQVVQPALQQNFQNYLLGQVALAVLVGCAMTVVFLSLKVPFGLLFGLGVGIMALIPFGDLLSFSLVSLLVASHNFWLGVQTLVVAVVVDQVIDQAIAPRLLGRFTGLSPIGILAALAIGTKVGGVLGLLIAVPLASSLKSALDRLQAPSDHSSTSPVELAAAHPDKPE